MILPDDKGDVEFSLCFGLESMCLMNQTFLAYVFETKKEKKSVYDVAIVNEYLDAIMTIRLDYHPIDWLNFE